MDCKKCMTYLILPFIVLAGIIYFGIVTINDVEQSSKEKTGTLLEFSKRSISDSVKTWKSGAFFSAQSIAAIEDIRGLASTKNHLKNHLGLSKLRELSRKEDIIAIVVQDKSGVIVGSSDRGLLGQSLNESSITYWNRVSASHDPIFEKPYKSTLHFNSNFNNFAMLITKSIRDEKSQFIGALTIIYDPRIVFENIMSNSSYGRTGDHYFFDSTGLVLSKVRFLAEVKEYGLISPHQDAIFNLRLFDPGFNLGDSEVKSFPKSRFTKLVEESLVDGDGKSIESYRDYRGKEVVGAWRWFDDLSIGLAIEVDYDEAYHDLLLLKRQSKNIALCTLLFFILYVFIMLKNIKLTKEMNEANKELVESQSELQEILSATDSHAIISKANTRGEITYVNKMFCEVSQYSKEELMGKDHRILNSGLHSKEFFENMWSTILSKKPWKGIMRNKKKNGDFYWVETTIFPVIDKNQRVKEFVAVRTDITKLKLIEQESQRARDVAEKAKVEMEKVMVMKNNFVAGISHELRTPLNAIIGYLAGLRLDKDKENIDEKLDILEQSSFRLLDLVNNTIDLKQLEGGRAKLSNREINLKKMFRTIEKLYRINAKQKELDFVCIYNVEKDNFIIDDIKLSLVLNNLISNALKNTSKGQISIVVDGKKISDEGEYELEIIIADSGCGIEKDKLDNIINNTFDSSTASGIEYIDGVGIGLRLVNGYLRVLGAKLQVDSSPGVGSSFTINLPCIQSCDKELTIIEGSKEKFFKSQFSVAVVDDNKINLNMMKFLLQKLGVEAKVYQSPLRFLEEYSENDFDLVFMDQLMPEVKGSEVVKQIKSRYESSTRFVSLSASTEASDLELFNELFDDVLTKPVKKEMILRVLDDVVKKAS